MTQTQNHPFHQQLSIFIQLQLYISQLHHTHFGVSFTNVAKSADLQGPFHSSPPAA